MIPALLPLLLPILAHTPATEGGSTPPNVLVLLADDIGVDSVAVYAEGDDLPSTPNLDALAAGGLLFRNAWSSPVCSPSRAGLLTGRHSFRHGVGWLTTPDVLSSALPLSELTIPEVLDLAGSGYVHAAIGKWHLGNASVGGPLAPNDAGFGHFSGSLSNLLPPFDYFTWPKVVDGVSSTSTNYVTTETVDDAIAWISGQSSPWFCYVAFHAAHSPFHAPPSSLHSVDLTTPTNRLYYKAMVEALDTEIGRLLASLPPGVGDDTMVIFAGDNGTSAKVTVPPFDVNHAKGTLYEGGINVPLIVSGPLVSAPAEVRGLVTVTDLFATVLGIAGLTKSQVPSPAGQDSVSLTPYFTNPNLTLREFVYTEVFRPNGPRSRPAGVVLYPSVPSFVCQDDVGFGGPGTATLTVCGEPLFGGKLDSDTNAVLSLVGAPPSSAGILYISSTYNPVPWSGGTLVGGTSGQSFPFFTDATGRFTMPVLPDETALGPAYHQLAVVDPAQPAGYAISNAVSVETLGTDMEVARTEHYKLVLDNKTGDQAFFDLVADPFEQVELLTAGPLGVQEIAAYNYLKAKIFELRPPGTTIGSGGD